MKTLLIGLFLGLTSLMMNSQIVTTMVSEEKLDEVVVSPYKNAKYFDLVNDPNAPKRAIKLEKLVAKYDITTATVFSKENSNYEVLFESEHGKVWALFNRDGEITYSNEKFEGIILPQIVVATLKNTYPDWRLNTTKYRVNYWLNKDIKRVYEVQLIKDNKRMNLKIDNNGVLLNPK
ncbi:hypothetical protein [uncultured Gelidibacter sp.]|uniref:hypothetical protein n=1 Tax=uncultured Gelidibacter sp. TaxID=259318 RepID=UPI00262CD9EE|nr:hypothetical protein [uncultured Gelidibacter sp.]